MDIFHDYPGDINELRANPEFNWDVVEGMDNISTDISGIQRKIANNIATRVGKVEMATNAMQQQVTDEIQKRMAVIDGRVYPIVDMTNLRTANPIIEPPSTSPDCTVDVSTVEGLNVGVTPALKQKAIQWCQIHNDPSQHVMAAQLWNEMVHNDGMTSIHCGNDAQCFVYKPPAPIYNIDPNLPTPPTPIPQPQPLPINPIAPNPNPTVPIYPPGPTIGITSVPPIVDPVDVVQPQSLPIDLPIPTVTCVNGKITLPTSIPYDWPPGSPNRSSGTPLLYGAKLHPHTGCWVVGMFMLGDGLTYQLQTNNWYTKLEDAQELVKRLNDACGLCGGSSSQSTPPIGTIGIPDPNCPPWVKCLVDYAKPFIDGWVKQIVDAIKPTQQQLQACDETADGSYAPNECKQNAWQKWLEDNHVMEDVDSSNSDVSVAMDSLKSFYDASPTKTDEAES